MRNRFQQLLALLFVLVFAPSLMAQTLDQTKAHALDLTIDTFQQILRRDSQNVTAMTALSAMCQWMGQFATAREYAVRRATAAPTDGGAVYDAAALTYWMPLRSPTG